MSSKLRLAFMGTPDFAVSALNAIVESGQEVVCVYCQPPRAAGRGQKLTPSPVQKRAEELHIPVRTPLSLKKDEQARKDFAALNLDIAVVAAYGLILPQDVLDAPTHGCLNIHASLLPRWRGAAPIQRAIMAGDTESGICIMQMEAGLDTGPVLMKSSTPITHKTTASQLHDALAAQGADLIVKTLDLIAQNKKPTAVTQSGETTAALTGSNPLHTSNASSVPCIHGQAFGA
jgi:methionyl-tRNA formyltransferase